MIFKWLQLTRSPLLDPVPDDLVHDLPRDQKHLFMSSVIEKLPRFRYVMVCERVHDSVFCFALCDFNNLILDIFRRSNSFSRQKYTSVLQSKPAPTLDILFLFSYHRRLSNLRDLQYFTWDKFFMYVRSPQ